MELAAGDVVTFGKEVVHSGFYPHDNHSQQDAARFAASVELGAGSGDVHRVEPSDHRHLVGGKLVQGAALPAHMLRALHEKQQRRAHGKHDGGGRVHTGATFDRVRDQKR